MTKPFYYASKKSSPKKFRMKGFESPELVLRESKTRQKVLVNSKNKESRMLGSKLGDCRHEDPCESKACPMCNRQYRIWFINEVTQLAATVEGAQYMTLTQFDYALTNKEYFRFNPTKLIKTISKQLERSGFNCPVIGRIEVDYSEEERLWLPHFHGVVIGKDQPMQELRQRYYSNRSSLPGRKNVINRPMLVQQLRDPVKQISYMVKFYNMTVIAFETEKGRRTEKQRLSDPHLRLDLRVSDRLGFGKFTLMYRCRRFGKKLAASKNSTAQLNGKSATHTIKKSKRRKTVTNKKELKKRNTTITTTAGKHIKLVAIVKPGDGTTGAVVRFKVHDMDGVIQTLDLRRSEINSDQKLREALLDAGVKFDVCSNPVWKDVKSILRDDTFPIRFLSSPNPGHHGKGYLMGNDKYLGKAKTQWCLEKGTQLHLPRVASSGSLEEWRDNVAEFALTSSRLMLALCAAFSGYIIRFSSVENGGFHFYSDSSKGKSTMFYLTESLRGPKDGLGTWDATEAGMMHHLAGHNDSFVTLDDIANLDKDPRKSAAMASKLTYKFADGKGKILSTAFSSSKKQRDLNWKLVVLSGGEVSLNENSESGEKEQLLGEQVRMIDVPADTGADLGIFDYLLEGYDSSENMAMAITKAVSQYYGTAVEAFLLKFLGKKLKNDIKVERKIESLINYFLDENISPKQTGYQVRFAKRFALAYAAGSLACEFGVLRFTKNEVFEGISRCYQDSVNRSKIFDITEEQIIEGAINNLRDLVDSLDLIDISTADHGYSKKHLMKAEGYITKIHGTHYHAIPSKTVVGSVGDRDALNLLLDHLSNRESIYVGKNGKQTHPPAARLKNKKCTLPRCYCFLSQLFEHCDTEPE